MNPSGLMRDADDNAEGGTRRRISWELADDPAAAAAMTGAVTATPKTAGRFERGADIVMVGGRLRMITGLDGSSLSESELESSDDI